MAETTTITLLRETVERLKNLGRKGDTYEEIVKRLLDIAERGGKFVT